MSAGHRNTGFINDDGAYSITTEKSLATSLQANKNQINADYDPYLHRNLEHPTSNLATFIHLIKSSLGIGILAMPNAFSHSGYIVGTIGTIIIGCLCTYCIHLLINAAYELCKRKKVPSLDYAGVAEAAFNEGPNWCKACAPYIPIVINIIQLIAILSCCSVYIVFIASNMKSISDYYTDEKTDVRLFMLIILLPLILMNWIRNLKYLTPLSTIANFVILISFGIILYYIFREPITLEGKLPVGELRNFPLFCGTVLFAIESICIMLPLENEMKTPQSFGGTFGVLNKAMFVDIILYTGMGLFGYLNYGHEAAGTITLNLPPQDTLAQCVKGMLSFTIFVSHGLACYVAIDLTWNVYLIKHFNNNRYRLVSEYIFRTSIVLITFLFAITIPNLELFIALFGAFCLASLGLLFPAIIQTCTFWYQVKGCEKIWMILKNLVIIIIGVFAIIVGTYTSIRDIIAEYYSVQSDVHH